MKRVLCVLAFAAACRPAEAHIVASRLGDFYAGALHPLTGLEDALLWVVLGVLAGTQNVARARWLVVLFPAGLLAGFAAGTAFGALDIAVADAGFMVLLGGLLAGAVRLPGPALGALAVLLGVMRGVANAAGAAADTNLPLFAAGLALAGYAAITLMTAGTEAFRDNALGWRMITLRAAGSWVAAIGLMAGGYALRAV